MERISKDDLERKVEYLNRMKNRPLEPWKKGNGALKSNIGNYHLSGAYGGWQLNEMVNESGGVRDIFRCGFTTKRDLYNLISAMLIGLEG
jgi:hypothetical protein